MSDQDNGQVSTLQRPISDDPEAWRAYWEAQGWSWRTELEIDAERQKYLAERRTIIPDIEKGIYPFKDIKLSRADVEWLLVTHENGRGPVDWSDESQHDRKGLDLRGAIIKNENLSILPLARLQGGLRSEELRDISIGRRGVLMGTAAIHLEEERRNSILFDYRFISYPDDEGLCETHLEGAELSGAFLSSATLFGAFLMEANLYKAHLEDVDLRQAHLEGAILDYAYLLGAHLGNAYLTKAKLLHARMDKASLPQANLDEADLLKVTLNKADLYQANLRGTRLVSASLRGANLDKVDLTDANLMKASLENASLVEAHLEKTNLEYAHLESADLSRSHLEGAFCYRTFFDGATQINGVTLSNEKYRSAFLGEVIWGNVNLTVVDWAQLKAIGEEILAHQRKRNNGAIKKPELRLEHYKSAVRANRQLTVTLQAQGLNEDASRFAYRAQLCQRVVLRLQKKFGQYVFSLFLDLLAGYGYRPGRSVIWYLVTIFVFAFAYHFLGGLSLYPPESFVFSIMSFHGRGFFPAFSQETNLHNPLVMLAAAEAIIGLLIEISFIATFTQRFFGR